jgi:hypothetical protein
LNFGGAGTNPSQSKGRTCARSFAGMRGITVCLVTAGTSVPSVLQWAGYGGGLSGGEFGSITCLGDGLSEMLPAGSHLPASVTRIPWRGMASNLRQEPDAVTPLVRICGGGSG